MWNRIHYNPGYIHPPDGLPGYPALPKKMPKKVKAMFVVIGDGQPVEAATAAPGETRAVKKPVAKKKATK